MARKRVCLVVLGDFERSPRMKYHTLSLTKLNYDVDVVAFLETTLSTDIHQNPKIHLHPIKSYSSISNSCPRIVGYFLKTFIQSLCLFYTLLSLDKPDLLLLQNPPSIPSIPVIWFYSFVRRVKFIIDWHNYGFTILSLTLGPDHLLVKICRWCEGYFGSKASYNLCVSRSMAKDLDKRWNIRATVLYDRPAPNFNPLKIEDRHEFLNKMAQIYPQIQCSDGLGSKFYKLTNGAIKEKENRPYLLISSTSWTEDEDFSILLEALDEYDSHIASDDQPIPELICVITGKGPLKSYYEKVIANKDWKRVTAILPWLKSEEYPTMIGAADVGVSLHKSSSNLDLPMKIIDMFGCGVPVLAIDYPCLDELVKVGFNGLTFKTSEELAKKLIDLLKPPCSKLEEMRKNLVSTRRDFAWEKEWSLKAKPLFV